VDAGRSPPPNPDFNRNLGFLDLLDTCAGSAGDGILVDEATSGNLFEGF
jgi:hypothetical protein